MEAELLTVGREIHVPTSNGSIEPFVNIQGTLTLSVWIDDDSTDPVLTIEQARLLARRILELAGE